MELLKIKEEPLDPLFMPDIKIEPIEEEIFATPPMKKTYSYSNNMSRKRANPVIHNAANCEPLAKKSATGQMRVLSKQCALCSNQYETFEDILKSTEVKNVCLVLGICSPNSSFEKLIHQNLPICSGCTKLFKTIHSQFIILNEADRKLKECVRKIGSFLKDQQMLTADKENLGEHFIFLTHLRSMRRKNIHGFFLDFRKVRKNGHEETEITGRLKSK